MNGLCGKGGGSFDQGRGLQGATLTHPHQHTKTKQVAQYLISKGVGVNEYDNVGGWTPLYAASFFGWPDVRFVFCAAPCLPRAHCENS